MGESTKWHIPHPGTFGPEAETRVPCPCCGKGMVQPTRAGIVKEALRGAGEEDAEAIPQLITEIIEPPGSAR